MILLPGGTFLDYVVSWNEGQNLPTPALHATIVRWLEDSWRAGDQQLLLMVFRDAGKSTLVGLFCAWLLTIDPNLRILVLSADQALATKMTRTVRRIVEHHPLSTHLKPKRLELWAADQLTVNRPLSLRDPSLLARGITGNITGSRADIVICDDVEVPNTCDTAQKRQDLRARLAEIGFVLVPGGTQIYVGTPHSFYSIYADRARPEVGEELPFLHGFRRLMLAIFDEQGRSRWPERFSLEHLERLRRQAGPLRFRSQMLLQPAHDREVRLDPDLLLPYEEEIETVSLNGQPRLRIGDRIMMGAAAWWDPAYGRPQRGDASVVAAVFTDQAGHYWLHAIRYLEVDPSRAHEEDEASQQCAAIAEFLRTNHQPVLHLETNGLGCFLPSLLRNGLRRAGVAAAVVEETSRLPKTQRILSAFDPLLAARRLHVHASVLQTRFIEEMREWTPIGATRDDGLDAVSGCISCQPVRLGSVGGGQPRPLWQPRQQSFVARSDFEP